MDSEVHVKRPMNCFMVWSREKRYHILKEHPGINNAEVSKALGAAWRKLSEEDKEPYVEEARRLTERHKMDNPGYKYQPRRRTAKRIKRRPEKKVAEFTTLCAKSNARKMTSEKIHFPLNIPPDPEILPTGKTEGRPLIWMPPHFSNRQSFPPQVLHPYALGFCSCHVFYAAPHFHPALSVAPRGRGNYFFSFGETSRLRPYNSEERSQTDHKMRPFIHECKL